MSTVNELLELVEKGNLEACRNLGHKYAEGDSVEQDYVKAMKYYKMGADKGDAHAIYSLAYCYLFGLEGDANHKKGIELMKLAAEKNIATANEHMGWIYFRNQFASVDYKKSFAYMKKAADLGDDIAQTHVAQAYENGIWGAPEKNYHLSKKYYDMALEQDNEHAQWAVGENYLGGYNGYPLNEKKAVEYFQKGAINGSHRAQLSLALCYYNGKGVQQNMIECTKWLKAASEQGNAEAQWRLGYFMIEGIDMPKDIAAGKQWIQKSAAQGEKIAIEMLEELKKGESQSTSNNSTNTNSSSDGGCYVATAVYGSYDCPQVWTLRRYRDDVLASTWYGRAFIHIYYAISPTLVKWFGHTKWFQRFWREKLDDMVTSLQYKGFENTPYDDKQW